MSWLIFAAVVALLVAGFIFVMRPSIIFVYSETCNHCEQFVRNVMPKLRFQFKFNMVSFSEAKPEIQKMVSSVPALFVEDCVNGPHKYEGSMDNPRAIRDWYKDLKRKHIGIM